MNLAIELVQCPPFFHCASQAELNEILWGEGQGPLLVEWASVGSELVCVELRASRARCWGVSSEYHFSMQYTPFPGKEGFCHNIGLNYFATGQGIHRSISLTDLSKSVCVPTLSLSSPHLFANLLPGWPSWRQAARTPTGAHFLPESWWQWTMELRFPTFGKGQRNVYFLQRPLGKCCVGSDV